MKNKPETSVRIENVPPITVEQHARLTAIAARSDEDIDYSDLPPLTDAFFSTPRARRFIAASNNS